MNARNDHQAELYLYHPPRPQTVANLVQMFGDVLVPLERIRERWFRNLNRENFARALACGRIALPITTLDDSCKAQQFVEVHQLAAYIEQRAYQADQDLAQRTQPQHTTDSAPCLHQGAVHH